MVDFAVIKFSFFQNLKVFQVKGTILFVLLIVSMTVAVAPGCSKSVFELRSDEITAIKTEGDVFKLVQGYHDLFIELDESQIRELTNIDDKSIAIQAEWQLELSRISDETAVQGDQFVNFIGKVEKCTGESAPDWWKRAILDSRIKGKGKYSLGSIKNEQLLYSLNPEVKILSPAGSTIILDNGKLKYGTNGKIAVLPFEILNQQNESGIYAVAGVFNKDYFVCSEFTPVGLPHTLYCANPTSGNVLWKSLVCGLPQSSTTIEGLSFSQIELQVLSSDLIAVYGYVSLGFYFHVFDLSDGSTVYRFSSDFELK